MWTRQDQDGPFLLTVGQDVHISDPRYSIHFRYPNNFRLSIAAVRREDYGQYACQINTHPPRTLITNVTILGNFFNPTFDNTIYFKSKKFNKLINQKYH